MKPITAERTACRMSSTAVWSAVSCGFAVVVLPAKGDFNR
jgi:hypothetical protein